MLVPAIAYKAQLEELFAKELYSERFFYYMGWRYCNDLPNICTQDCRFCWAILSNDSEKILGYIAYRIDPDSDTVDRFGLYSFEDGNLLVIEETYKLLEELIATHHRVEWRMISGNHAGRGYESFCKKHGGNIVTLHDVTKDLKGNYHDEFIYEIISNK